MQILTSEAKVFFSDLWDRHIKYLKSEHDITTPYDYLDYVGRLDDFDDSDGLREFLEKRDVPIDVFFQVAPFHGQEIMYASLNPGMKNSIDQSIFESGNEYGRKIATVGDPEGLAWIIATNMHGYLKDKGNPGVRLIIDTMREKLSPLPTDRPLEDYVRVDSEKDFKHSYYNGIYLTRVFKYPSLKQKHLDESDLKWARGPFAEEIEFVSPKLLICSGRGGMILNIVWGKI